MKTIRGPGVSGRPAVARYAAFSSALALSAVFASKTPHVRPAFSTKIGLDGDTPSLTPFKIPVQRPRANIDSSSTPFSGSVETSTAYVGDTHSTRSAYFR